jgi:DNA-binding winged helix-turn-helix (wHTH) protein/TolB-like protein
MELRKEDCLVRFGPFQANLRSGELFCNGRKIHLQDQPFQVLAVLLLRAGELVTREELRREVWPADTFLEFDHALNTAIKKIRFALSDDAVAPRYVQTIPKRGYRWIAPVSSQAQEKPAELPVSPLRVRSAWHSWGIPFVLGLMASLVSISLYSILWHTHAKGGAPSHTIAILPVQNRSGNPSLDPLCEGITLRIKGHLMSTSIAVVPESGARLAGLNQRAADTAAGISSDYSLHTNLQSDPRQVRIEAELIRVSDQVRIWHHAFAHNLDNPLEAEADLARDIATELLMPAGSRP